ncbi:tetratricopeptide repeat protein [Bacillus sp. ISL-47]|uniref:tetratricopeptide repeat protein n=1 Tax=Bacillus sp. ISL-47 TaxID=2819130 RepID=UPI001BE58344|nr:tetratricopeptide repeat protein [Bacillus sp. ISL-47]MBT2688120.1 tetratricopeptide repeat protein [Bacillus sp. ISL-47]MBT2707622.1 tetratricopeptide repeat protein [Pseudomonas sp. ISL-84]
MDKRERKKQNSKIILFPDVEKRLLEKGLESFQQRRYQESIRFFEEAMEIEPDNTDIHIGLVLAYFEAGALQKAKELANKMLQTGIGDYIQVMDLYLMILVQLHQYSEIVTTIEVLLEEREIPKEKFEHFSRMLEFSRKMAHSNPEEREKEAPPIEEFKNKKLNLFSYQDQNEQIQLAAQLAKNNIRPYIEDIKAYLESSEGHPFFKTMLLNVLSEHEYDKEVLLRKFGKSIKIRPSELPSVHQQPQLLTIVSRLGAHLEQEDPILYENTKSLIERHFFILYPIEAEPANSASWAAAYHSLANEYHGQGDLNNKLAQIYGAPEEEVEQALAFIRKIEEISYPNI